MKLFKNNLAGVRWTVLGAILAAISLALAGASSAGVPLSPAEIVAPPEPGVAPSIPDLVEIDANLDRIDDALETRIIALENARANVNAPQVADENVSLEFVFSAQIGQGELDQFVKLGGQVTHVYKSVSYGWNGLLPISQVREAVRLAGPALVGVVQSRLVQLHMDKATGTGRVRPYVWDSGYDGNSNITIAIMDTGVDDSHTDLAGRMEYWHDYTSDASATPVCVVPHGSHVAGIALGTGAASGVNPTTLHWTDQGFFPSTSGSFFPSVHEFTANVTQFDWTSNMVWQAGSGASAQLGQATVNASSFGFTLLAAQVVSSSSPITTSSLNDPNPFPGYLRLYSSYSSSSSGAGGKAYSTADTVSADTGNFGVGDSYNLFRGVAPGCRWAGAKVFPNSGGGASSTDIDAALDDMVTQRVTHNIKVINMSFGISSSGGTDPTERAKVNTAADNGIVACISAGNGGPSGEISDPGRAAKAITVGSANDINQLTDYTSIWTDVPDSTEDYKPDLLAPGGSLLSRYSQIMSVDSNDGDADGALSDQVANDYTLMSGTSMASPFVAGAVALVIDAWQTAGHTWSFSSSADPLFVKMMLCASSTETNQTRESGTNNPTLERASNNATTGKNKDTFEGYGMINPDAAVDAIALALASPLNGSLGSTATSQRAAGRYVDLTTGAQVALSLTGMTSGDYDLYLYDSLPDIKGNPIILASSTNAGTNVNESINYTAAATRRAYVFVKRVSGSGAFTLSSCVAPTPPTSASNDGPICAGSCAILTATGGSGTTLRWLTGSCTGTSVGTGNGLSVCPTTATTYYARWENTCGNSTCATTTVTVNAPALSVTPPNQNVACPAGSTTFTVSNTTGCGSMGYTTATGDSWLHIASGGSGSCPPNATIGVNFDANPGSTTRVGTITVSAPRATPNSATVTVSQDPGPCDCTALAISSAVSRKTHGTCACTCDIGSGGTEGRVNGPTTIVVNFNQSVHRVNNTLADFTLSSGTLGTVTVAGAVVTVNVSGVTDQAIFTIGFPGIASDCDNTTIPATKCWKVLQGDVNGISPVNNFDVLQIRSALGLSVCSGNCNKDVNPNCKIDNFDMLFTRSKLGHSVTGTCNP